MINDCMVQGKPGPSSQSQRGCWGKLNHIRLLCHTAALMFTREWLQALWQWLAARRQDLQLLVGCGWPLLPVLVSQLVPLRPLEQSAVVMPGADAWPAGLAEVLGKLGVHVLDSDSFELPVDSLKGLCVHSSGGTGVAAALSAALQLTQQQPQQQDVVGNLSASDRRLLRSFLLQPTWYAGAATAAPVVQLRRVARQLPLYKVANSCQPQLQEEAAGQAAEGEPVELEPVFVNLEGTCCLTPAGVLLYHCSHVMLHLSLMVHTCLHQQGTLFSRAFTLDVCITVRPWSLSCAAVSVVLSL